MKKVFILVLTTVLLLSEVPVFAKANDVYEKRIVYENQPRYSNKDGFYSLEEEIYSEMEEYKISKKEKMSYELLVPKTNANYEIAVSKEGGTFTYYDKADTYDEAVEKADEKFKELKEESSDIQVPTVIDNKGNTVYATESIGRVWKKYREGGTSGKDPTSKIYTDSSMTNAYTSIHDGFISEVPLIQKNENEAKVLASGCIGWMNTNINRTTAGYSYPNRDLLIQPITNVTNPSYYKVDNGILYHFVSLSMSTPGSGSMRPIGVAPSFLKEGQKYSSYDGQYFYSWTGSVAQTLRTLTNDLRNGNHLSAVNADNPYYNYYSYLPFRTKTNYTADEINKFIENNTESSSALRGLGQDFINAQNEYGVNAILSLGVAINESDWGRSKIARNNNNLFGLNAVDISPGQSASHYNTPADSINEFAKNYVSRGYADPGNFTCYGGFLGNKLLGANVMYASDPYWAEHAVNYAFLLDYEMSGKNISNMKDYNYYQLVQYTSSGNVTDDKGNFLYNINSSLSAGSGAAVGGVAALIATNNVNINGKDTYEINAERTTAKNTSGYGPRFDGHYNWSKKGYISVSTVKFLNQGKTGTLKEDINFDRVCNLVDLSKAAEKYNNTKDDSNWNPRCDVNDDGIVDIYDIARVASKI